MTTDDFINMLKRHEQRWFERMNNAPNCEVRLRCIEARIALLDVRGEVMGVDFSNNPLVIEREGEE